MTPSLPAVTSLTETYVLPATANSDDNMGTEHGAAYTTGYTPSFVGGDSDHHGGKRRRVTNLGFD